MNTEHTHKGQSGSPEDALVEQAMEVMIRHLMGEQVPQQQTQQAIQFLQTHAPEKLAELMSRAQGEAIENDLALKPSCDEAVDNLADYINAGDEAALRMPEVHQHLTACEDCRRALEALQETQSLEPEWKRLPQPGWLVFLQGQWGRLRTALSPASAVPMGVREVFAPLTPLDVKLSMQFGAFRLVPVLAEGGLHFAEQLQPVGLELALPDRSAVVQLRVTPTQRVSDQRIFWDVTLHLLPPRVTLEWLSVGLGPDRNHARSRHLVPREDCHIELDPPPTGKQPCQVFVQWKPSNGDVQSYEAPLPVLELSEDKPAT